jgi:hypothetical protein
MVICACGLLSNPAKVLKFQYTACWYSIDQKFHADVEKTHGSQFWTSTLHIGFNGHDPTKVPKFKYRHDGALSFRNFALNQAHLIMSHTCQLTNNQKMCSLLPWYTEFPIYFLNFVVKIFRWKHCWPSWAKMMQLTFLRTVLTNYLRAWLAHQFFLKQKIRGSESKTNVFFKIILFSFF